MIRRCHKRGEAIRILENLVILCECITSKEAGALYGLGMKHQKESENE